MTFGIFTEFHIFFMPVDIRDKKSSYLLAKKNVVNVFPIDVELCCLILR